LTAVVCLALASEPVGAGEGTPVLKLRAEEAQAAPSIEHEAAASAEGPEEKRSIERLKQMLREIIVKQQRYRAELQHRYENLLPPCLPKELAPTIGEAKPVVLEKGGRAKVTHTIRWRQYPEDVLTVTVTPSDPSLAVPAKLTLEFEKNEVSFEYEITAGDKAGTFSLTLTPQTGSPVVVAVTVK